MCKDHYTLQFMLDRIRYIDYKNNAVNRLCRDYDAMCKDYCTLQFMLDWIV